ncbi:MAG: hypothetical protein MK212_11395 [Saprospiraceae bacterium]|nr:hypothetical protein [Saprospiraceae bacterium]
MKPSKKQLKRLDEFKELYNEYQELKNKLSSLDTDTTTQAQELEDDFTKVTKVIDAFGKNKSDDASAKGGNALEKKINQAANLYEDVIKKKGLAGLDMLINGIDKFDKSVIAKAEAFLEAAKTYVSLAETIPVDEIKKQAETVKGWISSAETVIAKIKQYEQLLLKWANIAKGWLDSGIDGFINTDKKVEESLVARVGPVMNDLKGFIRDAGSLKDDAFTEKLSKARDMLDKGQNLLNKASEIIGIATADENQNNLPDWWDKLMVSWNDLGGQDLIKGTDWDDKILGKIDIFRGSVERWLEKAMDMKDSLLDKIVTAQQWIEDIKKFSSWIQSAKDFIDDIKNKDGDAIYDKLKLLWDGIDKTEDIFAGTELDNKLLDWLKANQAKADEFAKLATSILSKLPGGEKLGNVETWIKGAIDVATRMQKGENVVKTWINLAKTWVQDGLEEIVEKGEKVKAEVFGRVTAFSDEVKKFVTAASAMNSGSLDERVQKAAGWVQSANGILDKASEILDLITDGTIEEQFEQFSKFWKDNFEGKDFIQGTNLDNEIIGKLSAFQATVASWLDKAIKATENVQDIIATAKQWVGQISKALEIGAGIISDVQNKDWESLYEKILKGWNEIDNLDDILAGTKLDNKIIEKLQGFKADAESWLANVLTGGKANGDIGQIKDILSVADRAIRILFMKQKVEDFSEEFKEDKIIITPPELKKLSPEEEELLFNQMTGGMDAPLVNQLGQILTRIHSEMADVGAKVDAAYQKTLNQGIDTSNAYLKAKRQYDSAMKIQKEKVQLLKDILKIASTTLVTLLAPAAGVATGVALAGLDLIFDTFEAIDTGSGDFSALEDAVGGGIGGTILSAVLGATLGGSSITQAAELDLEAIYKKGIEVKYKYVKGFVTDAQKKVDDIYKNLWKAAANEHTLEEAKSNILSVYKQWQGTSKQIEEKYINTANERINSNKAYVNFSRALYAGWLLQRKPRKIRGQDPLIVDEVITQMTNFGILSDAKVKWDKGWKGDVSRFFGWLLGSWASKYSKKVEELRKWAGTEANRLVTENAWKGIFKL